MQFRTRLLADREWMQCGVAHQRRKYLSGNEYPCLTTHTFRSAAKRAKTDGGPTYCYHVRHANGNNWEAVDGIKEHVTAGLGWHGTGAYCTLIPLALPRGQVYQTSAFTRTALDLAKMVLVPTTDAFELLENVAKGLYGVAFNVQIYKTQRAQKELMAQLKLLQSKIPQLEETIQACLDNIGAFLNDYREYFNDGDAQMDRGLDTQVSTRRAKAWRRSPWTFMLMRAGWKGVMFADEVGANNTLHHGVVVFDIFAFTNTQQPTTPRTPFQNSSLDSSPPQQITPEQRVQQNVDFARQVEEEIEKDEVDERNAMIALKKYQPIDRNVEVPESFFKLICFLRGVPPKVVSKLRRRGYWIQQQWGNDVLTQVLKDQLLKRYVSKP